MPVSVRDEKFKIIRLPAVKEKTGWKRSSIYRMVELGRFPKPISLGARAVGWVEDEVDQWIASRIAASRGGAQ
jgi:prophage regulatory protein